MLIIIVHNVKAPFQVYEMNSKEKLWTLLKIKNTFFLQYKLSEKNIIAKYYLILN